jgi:hypothetical protein
MELILFSGIGSIVLLAALLLDYVLKGTPRAVESGGQAGQRSVAGYTAEDIKSPYDRAA